MVMSGDYGPADEGESIATIRAALDNGVTLLDTGDYYAMGHNELLVGSAIADVARDQVTLSVKFGAQRGPDGRWLGWDARPAAVKTALAYSLKRLRTDYVDIYRPGRADPDAPIEETIGAIAELVEAGYVRFIGLSEVDVDTLRRAAAVHPICDLQIEYSLVARSIEDDVLPACRELGIGITAYSVLAQGLLSGTFDPDRVRQAGDIRPRMPRFAPESIERGLAVADVLRGIGAERGTESVAQLAIGWVLAQGEEIVPIVGARSRQQLADLVGAAGMTLAAHELEELASA